MMEEEYQQSGPSPQAPRIPQEAQEKALKHIQKIAHGNGFDARKATLNLINEDSCNFLATTKIELNADSQTKSQPGRLNGPQEVSSPQDLNRQSDGYLESLKKDPAIKKQILSDILTRGDKGFGLEAHSIDLKNLNKQYVYYQGCGTCKTTGYVACQRCHAKGFEVCPQCKGNGLTVCMRCRGAQMVADPNGRQVPCTQCHGKGDVVCPLCQQEGKVSCRTCQTKGKTPCTVCQTKGWQSNITTINVTGKTYFEFDDTHMPSHIAEAAKKSTGHLHQDCHFTVIQRDLPHNAPSQEQTQEEQSNSEIVIHYDTILPYQDMKLTIEETDIPITLFGQNGRLENVPPFLDKALKPGLDALARIPESANPQKRLEQAVEFKVIKQALYLAIIAANKKAIQKIKSIYAYGISDAAVTNLVESADKAGKSLTRSNRARSFVSATGITILMLGAYIFAGLRTPITGLLGNPGMHMLIDIFIVGANVALVYFTVQTLAKQAVIKSFASFLPENRLSTIKPKTDQDTLRVLAIVPVVFIICCEIAFQLGLGSIPGWYASLRG